MTCPLTLEMKRAGDTRVALRNFWNITTSEIYEWEGGQLVRTTMHRKITERYPSLELWLDPHVTAHLEVDKHAADYRASKLRDFFDTDDLEMKRRELKLSATQVHALANMFERDSPARKVHRSELRFVCTNQDFDKLRRLRLVERWIPPAGKPSEAYYSTRAGRMRVRLEAWVLASRADGPG
jgi:hypothetical protein